MNDTDAKTYNKQYRRVQKDDSVKVIVIASTGNVFCSGHNLKEINEAKKAEDKGESYYLDLFKTCSQLMQFIINCPKPVIAEVNGVATAAIASW